VDAVILDGAEVGQGLEQREGRAVRQVGRAGERQADAQEGAPGAVAEDAARLEQRLRLGKERRARSKIDIGVEDQREEQGDALG